MLIRIHDHDVCVCDLVSSDVELPLAGVRVALQQHGAHAEDLLHHCILPQVVLTLFTARGHKGHRRIYSILQQLLILICILYV